MKRIIKRLMFIGLLTLGLGFFITMTFSETASAKRLCQKCEEVGGMVAYYTWVESFPGDKCRTPQGNPQHLDYCPINTIY